MYSSCIISLLNISFMVFFLVALIFLNKMRVFEHICAVTNRFRRPFWQPFSLTACLARNLHIIMLGWQKNEVVQKAIEVKRLNIFECICSTDLFKETANIVLSSTHQPFLKHGARYPSCILHHLVSKERVTKAFFTHVHHAQGFQREHVL